MIPAKTSKYRGFLSQITAAQRKLLYAHAGPVSQGDKAFQRTTQR